MSLKLDRLDHFGIVSPPENGAHFFQNGFYFDVDGEIVEAMLDTHGKARLKRILAERDAEEAAERARSEVLAANGIAPPPRARAPREPKAPAEAAPNEPVDLVAWLKGEKKYPFFSVRGAIAAQHSFNVGDKAKAVQYLVQELQLLPQSEVRV